MKQRSVSLRLRMALALAALAATTALAVAFTGYRSTQNRLDGTIDSSLYSYAERLTDPDGRLARLICSGQRPSFGQGPDAIARPGRELIDFVGAQVTCINKDGTIAYAMTDREVTESDLAVARGEAVLTKVRGEGSDDNAARILTVRVQGGAVQIARSTYENEQVLDSLRSRYTALLLIFTLLSALIGWFVAKRAIRPVIALTDITERVAASRSLDVDVPVHGSDETGRLARSFATMLDALRTSREQQRRLVQDAGHELRTPLTSMRTNISTLQRHRELPPAEQASILAEVDQELRELTSLTNELVALAMDEGDNEVEETIALSELVHKRVERARRRSGRTITITAKPVDVVGKPRQISRLIDNLLENAVKFTPPDTSIEVGCDRGVISVRDHGSGIPPDDIDHVFERFYRSVGARSTPGSGLGLSIVKLTAESHGGTARVENHRDGGALFTVTLPVATTGEEID